MLNEVITAGFRVLLIDTITPDGGQSFTHPDYDPFWARVQEADLAITLHIGANGGSYNPIPESFFNNGRHLPRTSMGDTPANALSYMGLQYNAELFLSAMIFDGVLERFPGLRIASDYPHHEGTDDPIGRFERTMIDVTEPLRQKFYTDNFCAFIGSQLATSPQSNPI
jgi:predicted TIM-barrel fold metal-dependent hydrolase